MQMDIIYKIGLSPKIEEIMDVYESSTIKRPVDDPERISKMYAHSNLIVSAWHENELIGIARSLTDFCYCCYLSDLAVKQEYQKKGVGKKLIELTKEQIGKQTALILISAPAASEYYPKVGFQKIESGFIIKREE